MPSIRAKKSQLTGRVTLPPSKSQSIRAILFASMAKGTSTVDNYLNSPDINAMITACRQLGANIKQTPTQLSITGVNGQPKPQPNTTIDAGNSGQVLRFIACLASLQHNPVTLTGDHSIRHQRPIKPLLEALPQLGVQCSSLLNNDHAPFRVQGPLQHHQATLNGEDSQPVSGLLMTLALQPITSTLHVINPGETPWIDLTLSWLDRFHIQYSQHQYNQYTVHGTASIPAFHYTVPGDLSSLSYPLVAAIITQSQLTINNVNLSEPQGDKRIINILQQMGANIVIDHQNHSLQVYPSANLHGITVNINDCIDCICILAVIACFANSTTTITGARIARLKESDRIACIAKELNTLGANLQQQEDGLIIHPSTLHAATVNSHHDHRIALSLITAAMTLNNTTHITNTQCIAKSFPEFVHTMHTIGAQLSIHEDLPC